LSCRRHCHRLACLPEPRPSTSTGWRAPAAERSGRRQGRLSAACGGGLRIVSWFVSWRTCNPVARTPGSGVDLQAKRAGRHVERVPTVRRRSRRFCSRPNVRPVKAVPLASKTGKLPVSGKEWKIVKRARKPGDAREEIERSDPPSCFYVTDYG